MAQLKVTVIIPTKNEEADLEKTIEYLLSVLKKNKLSREVIIADDASTDATPRIMDKLSKKHKSVVAFHRKPPFGFGHAITESIQKTRGEIIVIMMADLSDDPAHIPRMIRMIDSGCDVVVGSRFIRGAKVTNYPQFKMLANRAFNNAVRIVFLLPYTDISNAFKAYRADVLKNMKIESGSFDITAELPLKAHIYGYHLCEMPISWNGKSGSIPKWRMKKAFRLYSRRLFDLWLLHLRRVNK